MAVAPLRVPVLIGVEGERWEAPMRDETFRGTLRVRNPDAEPATLIVTRQGSGRAAKVWVTFDGGWVSTAVLDHQETAQLADLLRTAAAA